MTYQKRKWQQGFNKDLQRTAMFNDKRKTEKMGFDLSNYETVESRLARFWEAFPDGRIETCMMSYDGDSCVFRAELYRHRDDPKPTSTGYAHEVKSDRGVNMTSWCENGETSAIGRACANFIFATQGKRPSREEMGKVARLESQNAGHASPTATVSPVHTPSGAFATPKQIGYIKKLAKDAGMDDLRLLELIQRELNSDEAVLELLKSHEASRIIEVLK